MNRQQLLALLFIAMLVLAPTACRKKVRKDGNAMRAAFMTTLALIVETRELEKELEGNPSQHELALAQIIEKTEAAHALALSVDDGFLRWIDPGLPDAFSKLRESLGLRANGMRRNDVETQTKAKELWHEWGDYWSSHDEIVYRKLKVE